MFARATSRATAISLLAIALMLMSIGLRLPAVLGYHGEPEPHPFNVWEMSIPGGYSDIAHLYFRDRLWHDPVPYVDFRFEYPVLAGSFVWLAATISSGVTQYVVVSGLLLTLTGYLTLCLIRRFKASNAWFFAAAPALAFYSSLNWDLLGILLLVAALLLLDRGRDSAGSAVLAFGTAAKFFPIIILPILLALRVARTGWRSAIKLTGVFAAVTTAVNVPFAIDFAHGGIRPSWLYFFELTNQRPPRATIWKPLLGHGADMVATPVLVIGLAAIVALTVRARGRDHESLVPGSAAALLWVFGIAKVYSPQYALWIFALLAICGAPRTWFLAFAAVDVLVFATTFGPLYPGIDGFPLVVQWIAYGLRQAVTIAMAVEICRTRLSPSNASPVRMSPALA